LDSRGVVRLDAAPEMVPAVWRRGDVDDEVEGEEEAEEDGNVCWRAEVVRGDVLTREVLARRPWGERTYKGEPRPVGELVPLDVPEAPAVPESDSTDSARRRLAFIRPGL
jgi:hypothetical protein